MATIPLHSLKVDAVVVDGNWLMVLSFVAVMFYIFMNSTWLIEKQRGYNARHAALVAPAAPVVNHYYYGNRGCNCVGSANKPLPPANPPPPPSPYEETWFIRRSSSLTFIVSEFGTTKPRPPQGHQFGSVSFILRP
ncbi:hypothetical protein CNMCM5793_003933 [Aspergillus hiratsukae]|uniref:Uncharacterized protein n=1 Tax=Aspergillus hiratsukae TaxID=1194566 RepID=A0A8H6Q9Y8_9EURO|nr:hypothetical protein CNMCM5793_003933 [Aspergillus hiratsukae]KAF7169226.1 hypothetical protein CNMCM6106_004175 [Aspergillus hiratsukae]